MKKFMIVLQIFVALLFMVKIVALAEIVQKAVTVPAATGAPKRAAAETPPPNVAASAKEKTDDGLSKSRDLFKSLEERKEKLEKKELFLKSEEQRLLLLKKEILEKIDLLRLQEEKLTAALEAGKTAESKVYKDLAKVFEATPPAKAGVMLEQLDVRTAAGITMNMKRDKAGIIWGYLSPRKAVEITREITSAGKQNPN
ncbi:MAG TPA: hypothetical protein VJZ49_02470 [Syntrophales bacterium]|nr:hypothetical protein [Syntrophales bacterium]